MPTYDYQCQACGEVHEAFQKINDPVLKKCPKCGKLKLQKLISSPRYAMSGTRWYEKNVKNK